MELAEKRGGVAEEAWESKAVLWIIQMKKKGEQGL